MPLRSLRALAAICLGLPLVLGACGKKDDPAPPATTPPATSAPTSPAAEPDTAQAAAEPDTTAPAAEADTAAPAVEGGEWLVWFWRDNGWVTRWVKATAEGAEVVAERKTVVIADGTRLWRLERRDVEDKVSPCVCLEDEKSPDCKVVATLTRPGLVAVELAGDQAVTPLREATAEGTVGDGIDTSLNLHGGAGTRLFFSWGESGFMCGAHGTTMYSHVVFDLSAGKAVEGALGPVGTKLPAAVRGPAAQEIFPQLKECDGDEVTPELTAERMSLGDVAVSLDGEGAVKVSWGFAVDVVYACSADYLVHGAASSGPLPEAADLGLGGPVPPALASAFKAIGATPTVGWSEITATGDARTAALAAFEALGDAAWPPSSFTTQPTAEAAADSAAAAVKLVNEARKLTRDKKRADAIFKFNEAISLAPTLATAYSGRGYAFMLDDNLEGAKADFDKALTLDATATFQAPVYYNLGQVAEKQGDKAAAKAAYEKSLALRPNDAVQKALDGLSK